jgi:hypothetical protein
LKRAARAEYARRGVTGRRRSSLLAAVLAVAAIGAVARLLLTRSPSRGHGIVFQAKVDGLKQLS